MSVCLIVGLPIVLFRNNPDEFDLVITDMTMPNLTGDNLARELMKIRPEIPVIVCTGYSKKISMDVAAQIGIKAICDKPITMEDLSKIVRKTLDDVDYIKSEISDIQIKKEKH